MLMIDSYAKTPKLVNFLIRWYPGIDCLAMGIEWSKI
jgi:hypothetical protein